MQLRVFIVGAGAAALIGLLGFRILDLEQRVTALSAQLGSARAEVTSSAASSASTAACERRLDTLEQRMARLSAARKPASALGAASDDAPAAPPHDEAAILSIVERENSRIRDVQLEFAKTRWIEGRDAQLALFAGMANLDTPQVRDMHGVLADEVERMVEVLRRPGLAEDPDQFAADWKAVLAETDRNAARVLTPEQMLWWHQGRSLERQTLWPWLPKDATAHR